MAKLLFTALVVLFLSVGCGIMPKRVELGQEKVRRFPVHKASQTEAERQAVALAGQKAREAEKLALDDSSDAAVPAGESAELSEAVGRSLGPPLSPWSGETKALALRLDTLTAKYNRLLLDFQRENDQNAGKRIEGTGFLQVPYFLWVGGIFAVGWILWMLLKAFVTVAGAANPGVAVGLKVAQVGGKVLSRGFSQVLKGGEEFKNWAKKEISDVDIQDKVLQAFRRTHETAQDDDVKQLVQKLTK